MGQKSSDLETIPLNALYHAEQHRIGLRAFCRTYDLNIPELLAMLNEKPRVRIVSLSWRGAEAYGRYVGDYRGATLALGLVSQGLPHSIKLLKDRVREILSDEIRIRLTSNRTSREA